MTPLTSRHGSGGLANPASSPQPTEDNIVLSSSDLDRKQAQEKQTESGVHTSTHNGVSHTARSVARQTHTVVYICTPESKRLILKLTFPKNIHFCTVPPSIALRRQRQLH